MSISFSGRTSSSSDIGSGVVTDLNAITKSGIYYTVGGAASHTPNDSVAWQVIHTQEGDGSVYATQIAYGGGNNNYQSRRIKSTTWGVWTSIKLGNSATLDVGTTAGTVAAGNDARFPS